MNADVSEKLRLISVIDKGPRVFSKRFCVISRSKIDAYLFKHQRSTNICSIEVVLYTVIMYIHVLNVIGDLSTVASHSITNYFA